MSCLYSGTRYNAYRQNMLPIDERKKVDKHLKKCPSCHKLFYPESSLKDQVHKQGFNRNGIIGIGVLLFFFFFWLGIEGENSWWKNNNEAGLESLNEITEFGVGTKVMSVSESNGVRLTVTHAVADDLQTILYYQVEDLEGERQFWINPESDKAMLTNLEELWDPVSFYAHNTTAEKNYGNQGRISFPSMEVETGKLEIEIDELIEVKNGINPLMEAEAQPDTIKGNWSFTVPIEKQKSIVHNIQLETVVAGNLVKIDQVTIAPTTTLVSYQIKNRNRNNQAYLRFKEIETSTGVYSFDPFNYGMPSLVGHEVNDGWIKQQVAFDSVYFSNPGQLQIHLESLVRIINVNKKFSIDPYKKETQVINFKGGAITIKNIKLGETISLEVEEGLSMDREYEMLNFEIHTQPESHPIKMNRDWVFVTEDGTTYTKEEFLSSNKYHEKKEDSIPHSRN